MGWGSCASRDHREEAHRYYFFWQFRIASLSCPLNVAVSPRHVTENENWSDDDEKRQTSARNIYSPPLGSEEVETSNLFQQMMMVFPTSLVAPSLP